jgi:hypothetical protein
MLATLLLLWVLFEVATKMVTLKQTRSKPASTNINIEECGQF